jgi:hypothetical protein
MISKAVDELEDEDSCGGTKSKWNPTKGTYCMPKKAKEAGCGMAIPWDVTDAEDMVEAFPEGQTFVMHAGATGDGTSEFEHVLDSGAGAGIIKSRRLLSGLRESEAVLTLSGVERGSKPIVTDIIGDSVFGEHFYSERSRANLSALSVVRDTAFNNGGYVNFDCKKDQFEVQMEKGGVVRLFKRNKGNTYSHDVRKSSFILAGIATVKENEKAFSKREVRDARAARDLSSRLGFPSDGALAKLSKSENIKNCHVSVNDIARANVIDGKSVPVLKGKTTTHKSPVVKLDQVSGRIQRDQVCNIDLMFVEGKTFLLNVVEPLNYTYCSELFRKTGAEIKKAILKQLSHLRARGFEAKMVRSDPEGGVVPICDQIEEDGKVVVNITAAKEAVPKVERKIRVIKERCRCILNSLPYLLMASLIGYLVSFVVARINMMPSRTAMAEASPFVLMNGFKPDVKTHLKHSFGEYVQVHLNDEDGLNSMHERTSGGIALVSTNKEGSWQYLRLKTMKKIVRQKATRLPMPEEICNYLTQSALNQPRRINADVRCARGLESNEMARDFDEVEEADEMLLDYVPVLIHPPEEPADDFMGVDIENNAEDIVHAAEPFGAPDAAGPIEFPQPVAGVHEAVEPPEAIVALDPPGVIAAADPPAAEPDAAEYAMLYPAAAAEDAQLENVIVDLNEAAEQHRYNLRPKRAKPGRWADVGGLAVSKIEKRFFGMHLTVKAALKKLGEPAMKAIVAEVQQLSKRNLFSGVQPQEGGKVIPSSMFLKEKYLADGSFDKLKARLVAGGHMQDRSLYADDASSPTVATSAVFMVAAIAAHESRAVATIDFPGAYLFADMPDDKPVVKMRLDNFLAAVLVKLDKSYDKFLRTDGTMVVRLNKALYGCIESARLWYNMLKNCLERLGFSRNGVEACVFNRVEVDGSQCTLAVHVDDMLVTSGSEHSIDMLVEELEASFPNLSVSRGRKLNYLGMVFDFSGKGKVKITMDNFLSDLLKGVEHIPGVSTTPATTSLFSVGESEALASDRKEEFHSLVCKVAYLAKRVRPDLLTATAFLTTRVQSPTVNDEKKLHKLIRYIRGTHHLGIVLESGENLCVLAYVDASYGVHHDMRSHTGTVVGIGRGPIYCKSAKQRLNSKSSTEAELIGLSDSTGQVVWTRNFLLEQGYGVGAAKIYQDNLSTMALVKSGKSNSERTRHIAIRFFFVADRVQAKEIILEFLPTGSMLADILTKPLVGRKFSELRSQLLNWTE